MDINAEAPSEIEGSDSRVPARGDDSAQPPVHSGSGEHELFVAKAISSPRAKAAVADENIREPAPGARIGQLRLVPYFETRSDEAAAKVSKAAYRFGLPHAGVAAGLSLLLLCGLGALYDRSKLAAVVAAKTQENQALTSAFDQLKQRIDAIDSTHVRDEATDLHKVLNEIRAEASQVHELNASLTQLSTRVDHVEHDEGARIDKLAERIDRDSSARYADVAARLEKLEKKAPVAAPVVASAPPTPKQTPAAVKPNPPVSNETTGAVERPRPVLRGYAVVDVHDGLAEIDGREGPQTVGPGDFIPGAGRVQRVERRGHDWAVVTTLGVIQSDGSIY